MGKEQLRREGKDAWNMVETRGRNEHGKQKREHGEKKWKHGPGRGKQGITERGREGERRR